MTDESNNKKLVGFWADEDDQRRLERIQKRGHFPTVSSAVRHALIVADDAEAA